MTKEPEEEEWPPIEGEVGDPMTAEEAEAVYEALWALHLPPATDEEVARARWLAEIVERNRLRIVELIRRERAQDAKHGLPRPKDPTES